ncbi:MAG: DNA polymerase [Pseudoflavonifractor sp.]
MPKTMAVDIETYSSVDLLKSGVRPYTEAEDFEILLIAYKVDDTPTKLIDLAAGPDLYWQLYGETYENRQNRIDEFMALLVNPAIKTAYNAAFERTCLARWFQQPMPPKQWQCTMVLAANMGLPGTLAECGAALGLDRQKMTEGKNLISYFCKPCKPTKVNGGRLRNHPEDAPEAWAKFGIYCIRDVDVETDIRKRLERFYIPEEERLAWQQDQHINDMGVRLDAVLMHRAQELSARYTERLMAEASQLTGLDNPNSPAQLKTWLEEQEGVTVPSLNKEAMPDLMAAATKPGTRRMLTIRSELAKTSVSKYDAMERGLCKDGRAHNLLQFYGANRTGRWAGRLIQVQNLPQNKLKDLALARDLVKRGEFDLLEMAFGAPSFVLSQLIRTAFIPSKGCRFIIADYSAIEARVIAWLAGEEWVLEEFRGEGLIYEANAAIMFHLDKNDIKKGGPHADLRPKGKVATLACGYQGAKGALIKMGALESGIPEEELDGIVKRWRKANPHIVRYWYDVEAAAIRAVQGERVALPHGVKFFCEGGYLFIQLPSGRRLAYYQPRLEPEPKFDKMGITYSGVNQETKAFGRRKTYGGMLVENIVQATARDCLRDAMRALWAAGYETVMHVHDEVILDTPIGQGSLEDALAIMTKTPAWAIGLPLNAAGFESDFYMKD